MTAREALLSLSLKYEGNWDRMYKALKEKEPAPLELVGEYERNGGANLSLLRMRIIRLISAI